MYLFITSVASFYFCFAIETTLAAENGYILEELPHIPCKDSSSAIPECSGSLDYKIADTSNISNVPQSELEETRKNISQTIQDISRFADDKCIKGVTRYLCQTQYPFRCTEAYAEINGKKIVDTCEKARKNCTSLQAFIRDSILNCSVFANNPLSQMSKIPRKLVCGDFPALKNDPYSCDANYKVYRQNETELKITPEETIVGAHEKLKNANLTDAECEKNVADIACKAALPACSKDKTKLVALLSKQDCRKIVGCVNKTNNAYLIQGVHDMCEYLPDGTTAKTYPLDNVYDGAGTRTIAFSTTLFPPTTEGVNMNSTNVTNRPTLNVTTTDKSNTPAQFQSKISNLVVLIITFLVCVR